MSRSALILSLALHAAVLVAVGKWFAASAGSGDSGAGTRFSPAAVGGLLFEIAPAAEAAPAPLPPESELTPPAPTPETPTPVQRWTAQNSPVLAPPALAPNAKAVRPETGTEASS